MAKNEHSIYTLGDVFKVGFSRWIKSWKPIHLCWLFEKYGFAVPKYLIGGGNKAPELCGSRVATALRGWVEEEDTDVTDWAVGDDFCFHVAFGAVSGAQSGARIVQLRWRNASDGGSFAALGNTGELTYNGETNLGNGDAVTSPAEIGCTANTQTTWVNGLEREGSNDWTYTALSDGDWTGGIWAVDTANALAGKRYEFELYNVSDGAAIGTCPADLTTAVGDLAVADPFEAVAITEDVELLLSDIILAGPLEEVAIVEDVDVEIPEAAQDLEIADEFETVTVAEDVELIVSDVILDSPYEDIAIEEDVTAEVTAQPDLDVDEFELISLEEYIEALGDSLLINIFDTVDAAEDITAEIAHEFVLSLSDNFVDGAATTYQLEAPATKATTDFVAGKIHESSNPADSIDITADDYTELEFCFKATEAAGEVSYDFRIEGLDTYTVTPQLTISAGGETLEVNVHDCAKTKTCLV